MTITTGAKHQPASMQAANHHAYPENWSEAQKTVQVQRVQLSSKQTADIQLRPEVDDKHQPLRRRSPRAYALPLLRVHLLVEGIPGMHAEWETYTAMPGGRTDPSNWIIQSAIRGAQMVDGDSNDTNEESGAGQAEAGVLRTWGLARGFTMSGAYAPNLVKASKTMIYAIVDTLTRSREETRLS